MITDLTRWRRDRQVRQVLAELRVRKQYRARLDASIHQRNFELFTRIIGERALALRIASLGFSSSESDVLLRLTGSR